MTARLIKGAPIRDAILENARSEAKRLTERTGIVPGLVVVIVGDDPASKVYVNMKKKTCLELGWYSELVEMPATATQDQVADEIERLNRDERVHGILLQSPLPKGLDEFALIQRIDPLKDVDGFHPVNMGKLAIGIPGFVPCTPKGVVEMLVRSDIEIRGKRVVVAGRSHLVGTPLALLLSRKSPQGDATVTLVHSRTQDMPAVCREGDILIAAIGRTETITADYVKPGAVVVDVGTNKVDDPTRPKGYRLTGDVHFESVSEVASAITPSPGGVGPMTIAMLMSNTLEAAKRCAGLIE
ncbi:bifunctional 5,10-methylenetetrahydrofolate dehydrogenase/5,10-methenyltetrahydrofolate cyclohydrolase [Candidatus Sumerlaeota bacterium]|nr:bifunctional 5,10-methylenetetrahydrofolate dehydrogenase/5,10-methenyltetrahydrofolate cyclohydrolase [Candidatus Sumerlaeota bacterium]